MAYDRPRQSGEDVVSWAVATGRINPGADERRWRRTAQQSPLAAESVLQSIAAGAGRPIAANGRPYEVSLPHAGGGQIPAGVDRRHYAANPLVDDLVAQQPGLYREAITANPHPPTLFESGDLPPFMSSGADPALLAGIPWRARHLVAAAPTREEALQLIEEFSGPEGVDAASLHHNDMENRAYESRVIDWSMKGISAAAEARQFAEARRVAAAVPGAKSPGQMTEAEQDELLFGPTDRARQARELAEMRSIVEGRAVAHGLSCGDVAAMAAKLKDVDQ